MSPGEIDPQIVRRHLLALAGFRNVLVHGYLDVDVAIVHRLLSDELDDFGEFAAHVNRFLSRDSARNSG